MKLYQKGSKIKELNERKLQVLMIKKDQEAAYIVFLKNKINEIEQYIHVTNLQIMLFDSSASFTRDEFFTNRRQKAVLSLQLAHSEYERDNIMRELVKKIDDLDSLKRSLVTLKLKCEKFQIFLKEKKERNNILRELRRQEDIEDLYVKRN